MENSDERRDRLKDMLNDIHTWPSMYRFKFVLPNDPEKIGRLKSIFGDKAQFTERKSGKGNYVSYTVSMVMLSAEHIFEYYEAAAEIEGIISL